MYKKIFIILLTISMLLVSVGVYASENSELNLMNFWVDCVNPHCSSSVEMELIASREYFTTSDTHQVYDYYEGTCSACGNTMTSYSRGGVEPHSFTHIHKEINGSYVDLYKCTVCGYEVYNND